jgi:hypothetical protein
MDLFWVEELGAMPKKEALGRNDNFGSGREEPAGV